MDTDRARRSRLVRVLAVVCLACAVATTFAGRAVLAAETSATTPSTARETVDIARRLDALAAMSLEVHPAVRGADVAATTAVGAMERGTALVAQRIDAGALPSDQAATVEDTLATADSMMDVADVASPTYEDLRHLATDLQAQATTILEGVVADVPLDVLDARRMATDQLLAVADHLALGTPAPGSDEWTTLAASITAIAEPDVDDAGSGPAWTPPERIGPATVTDLAALIDSLDRRVAAVVPADGGRSIGGVVALAALTAVAAVAVVAVLRRDRRIAADLLDAAGYDELTGLLNRSRLDDAFAAVRANDLHGTGVLVLDLDGFKEVNDSSGHHAGDAVLREVGSRLAALTGRRDRAVRLGGDEFVLLLGDVHAAGDVAAVATRVSARLGEPIGIDGDTMTVGVSIGATFTMDPDADVRELIRQADAALYAAKAGGRGRTVFAPTAPDGTGRGASADRARALHP